MSMVLTLEPTLESPSRHSEPQIAGISDLAGLEWGLRIYISNKSLCWYCWFEEHTLRTIDGR